MIVFAAFTPHSPLLLPSINKTKLPKVEKTRQAMQKLAEELTAAKPDVIVIISSHGTVYDEAFSINLHDNYRVDFQEFGDLTPHRSFRPHLRALDTIQRTLRRKHLPVTLSTDATLDYGAAVPLIMLTEKLPVTNIVPMTFSGLSAKAHFQFGDALKEPLSAMPERVAVIASGDLSHALSTISPAGFDKRGAKFDKAVQEAITNKSISGLFKWSAEDLTAVKECAYRPLLILLGLLERINYDPTVHSYEAPFGVGYLVVNFELA